MPLVNQPVASPAERKAHRVGALLGIVAANSCWLVMSSSAAASTTLISGAPERSSGTLTHLTSVTVMPFAVLGQSPGTSVSLAGQACTAGVSASKTAPPDPVVTADLAGRVAEAVAKNIRAKDQIPAQVGAETGAAGSITIAGCITLADAGNGTQRLVGFGLGASKLNARVQLYRKTGEALEKVGEFDAAAEGSNKLPPIGPIGLVLHGAKAGGQTLSADADKLGAAIATTALKTLGR